MPQYFKEHGERLVELGYRILPLPPGSKGPRMKDWPQAHLSAADVRRMAANGSAQAGIGVIAATTPAIDVDILDPEVAERMSQEIDRIFAGQSLMTRTGRAPKFLIPFRSDEPFRKLSSGVYTDGKHDHHVEVLGDGQQWVAYHLHPATNKPYEWWNGLDGEGIVGLGADQLPVLTRIDAQRVIDAFEVLAADRVAAGHWKVREPGASYIGHGVLGPDDDPFGAQPVGKTETEVASLLKRHPNAEADYDHWFRVLCGVHHELGDAGRELAYAWSAACAKHSDEKFDKTWASLGSYKGRMSTLRSVMAGAEKESRPLVPGAFVPAAQFAAGNRVEWLVKHVLPRRSLIVVYGAPGSSKSFFVLDMVAAVARGVEWRGHRTRQCGVAYIAAEGASGFGNRLAAYGKGHDIDLAGVPLYVRGGAFSLHDQMLEAAEQVQALSGIGIVVIDTLASVTPGANENTSEDMGQAIDDAQRIIQATGASVILIHHANKAGEIRGWSGLLAAADNTIRVEGAEDLRTAFVEKQKEGAATGRYGYHLRVVDLYTDEDGDAVTSCVIDPCQETAPKTSGKKSRAGDFETSANYAKARHYLHIIEELVGLSDANIEEKEIIKAVQEDEIENPLQEPDHPRPDNIKRTLLKLGEKGKIRREGRWIRLCR